MANYTAHSDKKTINIIFFSKIYRQISCCQIALCKHSIHKKGCTFIIVKALAYVKNVYSFRLWYAFYGYPLTRVLVFVFMSSV